MPPSRLTPDWKSLLLIEERQILFLRANCLRHINAEKTILISSLCQTQIVSWRQFDHALKRTVVDLHDEKFALRRPATIGTMPGDRELISLHGKFQVFFAHASKLDLDDEQILGDV